MAFLQFEIRKSTIFYRFDKIKVFRTLKVYKIIKLLIILIYFVFCIKKKKYFDSLSFYYFSLKVFSVLYHNNYFNKAAENGSNNVLKHFLIPEHRT